MTVAPRFIRIPTAFDADERENRNGIDTVISTLLDELDGVIDAVTPVIVV